MFRTFPNRRITQEYYLDQLNYALDLIKGSIQRESEEVLFYDYLIQNAPTEEAQEVIDSIVVDEKRHSRLLKEIYYGFTGELVTLPEPLEFEEPSSYMEGLQEALVLEQEDVRTYRTIMKSMPNRNYMDMLFEIITDELMHGTLYSTLITMNLYDIFEKAFTPGQV
ncbi:ferritin-like domain-containing protein [Vallitalea okinawensis]|uniref:ferritin-like domain-containing protein n=1 Tax=Vallitalea okinawensis TaxID=2078660 RepID=UPI000CFBBE9B|nr:ferritin-like domain-containing protein [Vallitalea okinawensis]